MITQSSIGINGLLANQMFQYAALKGIAKSNGYDYGLHKHDKVFYTPQGTRVILNLYDTFEINGPFVDVELPALDLEDRRMPFLKQTMFRCPDNVDLVGFFQSPKYFDKIQDEIRKDFTFRDTVTQGVDTMPDAVALHVRRADYLQLLDTHGVLSLDYYEQALQHFDPESPVLVFSDDKEWCQQQELFSSDRFHFSLETDPGKDLYKMSQCKHFIIANSTYSWWAAWLGKHPDKQVIAPKTWFTDPEMSENDTDLIPADWKRI